MEKVYLLVQSGGSYDSAWSHILGSFSTHEKAELFKLGQMANDQEENSLISQLMVFCDNYTKENPRPPKDPLKDSDENAKIITAYMEQFQTKRVEFITQIGGDVEKLRYKWGQPEPVYYDIEEVAFFG